MYNKPLASIVPSITKGNSVKINTKSNAAASSEKKEFITVPAGKYLSKIASIRAYR
jgi:hypothetical protein